MRALYEYVSALIITVLMGIWAMPFMVWCAGGLL